MSIILDALAYLFRDSRPERPRGRAGQLTRAWLCPKVAGALATLIRKTGRAPDLSSRGPGVFGDRRPCAERLEGLPVAEGT